MRPLVSLVLVAVFVSTAAGQAGKKTSGKKACVIPGTRTYFGCLSDLGGRAKDATGGLLQAFELQVGRIVLAVKKRLPSFPSVSISVCVSGI